MQKLHAFLPHSNEGLCIAVANENEVSPCGSGQQIGLTCFSDISRTIFGAQLRFFFMFCLNCGIIFWLRSPVYFPRQQEAIPEPRGEACKPCVAGCCGCDPSPSIHRSHLARGGHDLHWAEFNFFVFGWMAKVPNPIFLGGWGFACLPPKSFQGTSTGSGSVLFPHKKVWSQWGGIQTGRVYIKPGS